MVQNLRSQVSKTHISNLKHCKTRRIPRGQGSTTHIPTSRTSHFGAVALPRWPASAAAAPGFPEAARSKSKHEPDGFLSGFAGILSEREKKRERERERGGEGAVFLFFLVLFFGGGGGVLRVATCLFGQRKAERKPTPASVCFYFLPGEKSRVWRLELFGGIQ